jgi:hypothetical protein
MRVGENACGQCLIATANLPREALVATFDGPVVRCWDDVPPDEVRYAIGLYDGEWLIPDTDARYLNHSCDPNCRISDELEVFTIRTVRNGEELTISYNFADAAEYRDRPGNYFWDERWNFTCRCGAANCIGEVKGYRIAA